MQTKLKQHLAIATGAVSAAAVPMGADAAIVYKDNANAFTVSFGGTTSAEWDIDGTGGERVSNQHIYFHQCLFLPGVQIGRTERSRDGRNL